MFPLGALIAGNPVQSAQQSYGTAIDQAGQKAFGNAINAMFNAPVPGAQPMSPMPGQASSPMSSIQNFVGGLGQGVRSLLGGGQVNQPQPGPQMAQAPMGGPMGGGGPPPQAPVPGAQPMAPPQQPMPQQPPPQPQQPSMGGGGGNPAAVIGQMSFQDIVSNIAKANQGQPPAVIAAGVRAAVPFMNAMALDQYRQANLQLRQMNAGTAMTRADTQQGYLAEKQWMDQYNYVKQGIESGLLPPSAMENLPPPPAALRQRQGAAPPAPAGGQYSPQQVQGAQLPEPGQSPPMRARQFGPQQQDNTFQALPARIQSGPPPDTAAGTVTGRFPQPAERMETIDQKGKTISDPPRLKQAAATTEGQIPRAGKLPEGATPIAQTDKSAAALPPYKAQAQGVIEGRVPPDLKGMPAKERGMVMNELQRQGFDLANAQLKYKQAERQVTSLNSERQMRFRAAAGNIQSEFDRLSELSKQMDISKYHPINRVQLLADAQSGNPLARQYLIQVNNVKENYARLVNQGYAPTSDVWELVNKQVSENFGFKEMSAALEELHRSVNYQVQALDKVGGVAGSGTVNPYTGAGGQVPAAPKSSGGSSGFDVEAAKKAGYSQKEIDDYLARRRRQ